MELNFEKLNGLVPAIIQDDCTGKVLMLGFMNREAYEKTVETGLVTFFSRTRQTLWTKGETSGNLLHVVSIKADCDNDSLLIKVHPDGPVCHTGTDTCWGEKNEADICFLSYLQDFIEKRHQEMPEKSYTTSLFKSGVNRMALEEGGRGERRNHHRSQKRQPERHGRGNFRPDLPPHRLADLQRHAHRRLSPGTAKTA